jgi:hypothetical protein
MQDSESPVLRQAARAILFSTADRFAKGFKPSQGNFIPVARVAAAESNFHRAHSQYPRR